MLRRLLGDAIMIKRLVLSIAVAGVFWSVVTPTKAAGGRCRAESPTVLSLTGRIDTELAACVAERLTPAITELVLNSEGGSADAAMDIAERLEGRRLTMRVRQECNSSCANFLLPLAGRLIVEPGALIVQHGSIDPLQVSRAGTPEEAERLARTAQRQRAFAERNLVHPGWLLYRTAHRTAVDALDGAWGGHTAETRAYIVEEQMARSCLGGIEIEPFQDALDRGPLRPDRAERLHRRGYARSATVVCNTMGWGDFPAAGG